MGRRIALVQFQSVLEMPHGFLDIVSAAEVYELTAAHVGIERVHVRRGGDSGGGSLAARCEIQLDLQRLADRRGDLVLDREDIDELPVV